MTGLEHTQLSALREIVQNQRRSLDHLNSRVADLRFQNKQQDDVIGYWRSQCWTKDKQLSEKDNTIAKLRAENAVLRERGCFSYHDAVRSQYQSCPFCGRDFEEERKP